MIQTSDRFSKQRENEKKKQSRKNNYIYVHCFIFANNHCYRKLI
jgi:hypothetical protein